MSRQSAFCSDCVHCGTDYALSKGHIPGGGRGMFLWKKFDIRERAFVLALGLLVRCAAASVLVFTIRLSLEFIGTNTIQRVLLPLVHLWWRFRPPETTDQCPIMRCARVVRISTVEVHTS